MNEVILFLEKKAHAAQKVEKECALAVTRTWHDYLYQELCASKEQVWSQYCHAVDAHNAAVRNTVALTEAVRLLRTLD